MKIPPSPELPLRDIHLPPPVSWWPPAPGWWALVALAAISISAWYFIHRRRRRPLVLKKQALEELRVLEQARSESDPAALARNLSVLLRRTSLSYYPRTEVAGLVGEAWLHFLDDAMGGRRFSEGPGRSLLDAPYRPAESVEVDALQTLCADWIRALPVRPRPGSPQRRPLFGRSKRARRTITEDTLSNGRKK